MSDLQQNFCKVLRSKGVKSQSLNRWEMGINSPNLITADQLCGDNDIELYFYDGNLFDLLEFARKKSEEQGHLMNYRLEKL